MNPSFEKASPLETESPIIEETPKPEEETTESLSYREVLEYVRGKELGKEEKLRLLDDAYINASDEYKSLSAKIDGEKSEMRRLSLELGTKNIETESIKALSARLDELDRVILAIGRTRSETRKMVDKPKATEISSPPDESRVSESLSQEAFESMDRVVGVLRQRESSGYTPFMESGDISRLYSAIGKLKDLPQNTDSEQLVAAANSLSGSLDKFGQVNSGNVLRDSLDSLNSLRSAFNTSKEAIRQLARSFSGSDNAERAANTLQTSVEKIEKIVRVLDKKRELLSRLM